VPVTVSVNMLGSRSRMDFHQRRINGAPHQKNTGVVSAHCSQPDAPAGRAWKAWGQSMPPMARPSTGTVSAAATYSRGRR
jgi:hypothetical protein